MHIQLLLAIICFFKDSNSYFVYQYSVQVGQIFWLFGKHVRSEFFVTGGSNFLLAETMIWHIKKQRFLQGPKLRNGMANTGLFINRFCTIALNSTMVMFAGFMLVEDVNSHERYHQTKRSALFDFELQSWTDYPDMAHEEFYSGCQGAVYFGKTGDKVAFVHVLESNNFDNLNSNMIESIHTYELKYGTNGAWIRNVARRFTDYSLSNHFNSLNEFFKNLLILTFIGALLQIRGMLFSFYSNGGIIFHATNGSLHESKIKVHSNQTSIVSVVAFKK